MLETDSNEGRKGRRKKKSSGGERAARPSAGLIASIVSGASLGAFVGLLVGYFLGPRPKGSSARESGQSLRAWREMVRKLSEQLQTGGTR